MSFTCHFQLRKHIDFRKIKLFIKVIYFYKILRKTINFSGQNSPTDSGCNSDDAAKKPKVDQNAGFEDIQVSAEDFTLFDENLSLESLFGSIQNSDLIAADGLITNLESGSKNNLTKPTPTSNHSPYRSHVPGYYSFWDIFTVRFLFSLFILLLAIWYF